jgi:hypothetical protein
MLLFYVQVKVCVIFFAHNIQIREANMNAHLNPRHEANLPALRVVNLIFELESFVL